jgi:hypothetical protein
VVAAREQKSVISLRSTPANGAGLKEWATDRFYRSEWRSGIQDSPTLTGIAKMPGRIYARQRERNLKKRQDRVSDRLTIR